MDLGTIQGYFADFATFGKNIGDAFQDIPKLLTGFVAFFDNFGDLADNTGTAAEATGDAGSTFFGSSEAEEQ